MAPTVNITHMPTLSYLKFILSHPYVVESLLNQVENMWSRVSRHKQINQRVITPTI